MPFKDVLEFVDVLSRLIVPLLGWGVIELRRMTRRLDAIERNSEHFDSWIKSHDKQDDERYAATTKRLEVAENRLSRGR